MPAKKKKVKITKAMESLYLKRQGLCCPYCGSKEVASDGQPLEQDGPLAWQNCSCCKCKREWVDRYELTGISEVDDDSPYENDCCPACSGEKDTEDEYCYTCTEKHNYGKEAMVRQKKGKK